MIEQKLSVIGARTSICFAAVFADGTRYQNCDGTPAFTLIFRRPAAAWRIAAMGHVGLLESYFSGQVDIEGDIALAFRAGYEGGFDMSFKPLIRLRNWWHELRFSNRSRAQAKANARFHYGLPAEFYRLWLDHPSMMYTCAYWKEGTRTLEEATVLFSDGRMLGERLGDRRQAFERATGLLRTWGDCYGYCLVATGRADVMIDPAMNPWDCAALVPILREAGGRFTDWTGVERIDGGDAVGTNGALHEAVLDLLR